MTTGVCLLQSRGHYMEAIIVAGGSWRKTMCCCHVCAMPRERLVWTLMNWVGPAVWRCFLPGGATKPIKAAAIKGRTRQQDGVESWRRRQHISARRTLLGSYDVGKFTTKGWSALTCCTSESWATLSEHNWSLPTLLCSFSSAGPYPPPLRPDSPACRRLATGPRPLCPSPRLYTICINISLLQYFFKVF